MRRYQYIYVNHDGSARELSIEEKIYLQTEYHFGDSARPYIKATYSEKNGAGKISGFCRRSELPEGIIVQPNASTFTDEYLIGKLSYIKSMGYEIDFADIEEIEPLWSKA